MFSEHFARAGYEGEKLSMFKPKLLHVYPECSHHVPKLSLGNNDIFCEYDNKYIVIPPNDRGFYSIDWAAEESCHKKVGWLSLLHLLSSQNFCTVIFHGAFGVKSWIVIVICQLLRQSAILIYWGGDCLRRVGGAKSWVKAYLRYWFYHVVFLSESDRMSAGRCYRLPNSSVVQYYIKNYDRFIKSSRRSEKERISLQIGNNASVNNGHLECIKALGSLELTKVRLFLPLGYERYSGEYVSRVISEAKALRCAEVDARHSMLPSHEFDAQIEDCDALLLGSRTQRALYNIFAYLCAGKAVFLPLNCALSDDLFAFGFKVYSLELLTKLKNDEFYKICREDHVSNRCVGINLLGLDSIKTSWKHILENGKQNSKL
jgi:hypothetical protein